MELRRLLPAAAIVALAGCGGGGGHALAPSVLSTPVAVSTPAPKAITTSVTLRIAIPAISAAALRRGPAFVSPSTQSMSISINGTTGINVDLTPGSPNCVTASGGTPACSVSLIAPAGNDTFAVTLYSGTGATGNVLAKKTLVQLVAVNATNAIALVLDGVVTRIGLTSASQAVPAGVATSMPLMVNAYDAQGNIIVGPGNYTDANSNPLTITVSAAQTAPTVQSPYTAGAATLSASTVTNPSLPVMISYDGKALLSTQFTATVSGGAAVAQANATLNVTPTIYEYPASQPNAGVYSLTVGPDKHIWVTQFSATPSVEHFAPPAPGVTTLAAITFPMPDTQGALGIAPGSDGNMWIASWNSEVYVCSLLGSCATISITMPDHPEYVFDGGDGNMYINQSYFTGPYSYGISTHLLTHDFAIGGGHRMSMGTDGRIWSAGGQGGCCYTPYILGLHTGTSADQSDTFVSMTDDTTNAAAGPDGNIWYVQSAVGIVGHLTSLTANSPTGITITLPSGPGLRGIAPGPDGNMYITETSANKIARVLINGTTAADITEYPIPTTNAGLIDLVTGPDGNIWFVENLSNQIGKLAL